jgi:hypothetical protein
MLWTEHQLAGNLLSTATGSIVARQVCKLLAVVLAVLGSKNPILKKTRKKRGFFGHFQPPKSIARPSLTQGCQNPPKKGPGRVYREGNTRKPIFNRAERGLNIAKGIKGPKVSKKRAKKRAKVTIRMAQ